MVWASGQIVSWTSPWGGVSGVPILEESPGQTKNMLERLHVSASLEPYCFLSEELVAKERGVCCPHNPDLDKWQKTRKKNKTKHLPSSAGRHLIIDSTDKKRCILTLRQDFTKVTITLSF